MMSKVPRAIITFIVAVLINIILFIKLAYMKEADMVMSDIERSFLSLNAMDRDSDIIEEESQELPEEPEDRIMEVDLDMPQPTPMPMEQVDTLLDLSIPNLSSISVPTISQPKSSKATAASPTKVESVPDADLVDQPPREIYIPNPSYPSRERRRDIEGTVRVRMLIGTNGRIKDIKIVEGVKGYSAFEKAVIKAVKSWRFEPAVHKGKKVEVWGGKRFVFELKD